MQEVSSTPKPPLGPTQEKRTYVEQRRVRRARASHHLSDHRGALARRVTPHAPCPQNNQGWALATAGTLQWHVGEAPNAGTPYVRPGCPLDGVDIEAVGLSPRYAHRTGLPSDILPTGGSRVAKSIRPLLRLLASLGKPKGRPSSDWLSPGMDPLGFEQHCAHLLIRSGWNALTTVGSGDQGADVIAVKGGRKLILQCKYYSSSVGNKAVQEAFAAQRHFGGHFAAVVTNSSYSTSAIALSRTTGVLCLHPSDLLQIDRLVGIAPRVARSCRNCQVTLMIPKAGAGSVVCPKCRYKGMFQT